MDNPELIEKTIQSFDSVIDRAHAEGLNYWQIFRIVMNLAFTLMARSEAEYLSKLGK